MSFCSFQAQLVSIMDILAKAAVAEINRRVDDSCAVIKLELSRSRRDIDALKRKSLMMENELRRVKGRGRRRVWICGGPDRFPPSLKSVCERDADAGVLRDQDHSLEQTTHNVEQVVQVLEDGFRTPIIKSERPEQEHGSSEGSISFDHEQHVQHVQAQESMEKQKPHFGDSEGQNTQFTLTQTSTEFPEQIKPDEECLSGLGLQVKAEKTNEEVEQNVEECEPPRDHLQFALQERDTQLWSSVPEHTCDIQDEITDRTFPTVKISQNTSIFSQPVVTEQSRNNLQPVERTQMEVYEPGQVNANDQNQPTWSKAGIQDLGHVSHHDRLSSVAALYPQRGHRTLTAPVDILHRVNITSQLESHTTAHAFPGCSRGGLGAVRRLRTNWRSGAVGERRFNCSFCERCFNRFSQLKEHLRSHTGEKPFTCTQCGRSFTKQCNLIRHAVVHSGEKPYQCGLCGKCFTQRSSLKSHQRTHAGDGMFPGRR